jgi:hypothetical protein
VTVTIEGLLEAVYTFGFVQKSNLVFDEVLMSDDVGARKEIDLVQAAVVQVWQLIQNLPEMNGSGVKWKELATKVETERNALCKHVSGQALFAGLLHTYAAIYKETWDSLQWSSMESGQEDASQPEQTKC